MFMSISRFGIIENSKIAGLSLYSNVCLALDL